MIHRMKWETIQFIKLVPKEGLMLACLITKIWE